MRSTRQPSQIPLEHGRDRGAAINERRCAHVPNSGMTCGRHLDMDGLLSAVLQT